MIRLRTNKLNNAVTGKGAILMALLLCLSAGFQTIQAEKQRVIVEPDDFPLQVDALNLAIEQNGGDVIYVLRNGGTYFLEASMEYEHFLHLEAEEYPSDNPPIVRPATDLSGNSRDIARYRGDVLMRGIFFFGLDDMGGKRTNQRTSGAGLHLHYQHCYFMSGVNYNWRLESGENTIRIEDSQMANPGRHTSEQNQRIIDVRGNDQDSIIIVNSSMYNFYMHLIRDGGAVIDNIYLDHITVLNHQWSALDMHLARNVTIKNSLFHSFRQVGVWESAELVGDSWPHYEGERYYSTAGMIEITEYAEHFEGVEDAPLDEDRSIVIKNNNFGGPLTQEYIDLFAKFSDMDTWNERNSGGRGSRPRGTDPQWRWDNPDITSEDPVWAVRDTIDLVRIKHAPIDSTLRAWAADEVPWVTIENNIEEHVDIDDMPRSMVDYMEAAWYKDIDLPFFADRWEDIIADDMTRYFHPGPGTPVAPTGATASWFRNLAYNQDSQSFMHAENNYPVGNLNFFPELRERWGAGEVITRAEEPVEQAGSFRLVGNYPNPFNPTTNIVFELGTASEVTLGIYNILGQQVQSMELGMRNAGEHRVNFDATNLTSGVYFVRMQVGYDVQTHSMTLIK